MQKLLSDYEIEDEPITEPTVESKPKTILEQINEMRVKKEGEDWGYKEDPKPKKRCKC